jgi:UDP-3-O-[3-hydroxymyristoyl] glucosamine N-acyltransferase
MLLSELAQTLSAELEGDPNLEVTSCATLDSAQPGQVSFVASPKYAGKLAETKASAVVVSLATKRPPSGVSLLKAKDPYLAFRNAVVALHGFRKHPDFSSNPQSEIPNPKSNISPLAYIHPTASIGEGTVIYPFVFVGPRVRVGRDCILYPSVTLYDDTVLGDRVILHAGCSIGHDGFGYATAALPGVNGGAPAHHKIPQTGPAIIEDDVELGANCSVDRATVGATVIGRGTKFSNNVVIGHGTKVGPHNLFVAQVGLAGSVTTGAYVVMGGQVGVAGHLKIADQVQIGAQSGVMEDLEEKGQYIGSPTMPGQVARRVLNHFLNLDEVVKRIRELEKKVETLSGS